MKTLCDDEDVFYQYFDKERLVIKVLGYKRWMDIDNYDDIPRGAFAKIGIEKFKELRDLLNVPVKDLHVLSFDDRRLFWINSKKKR